MQIQPLGIRVLVKSVPDEKKEDLFFPDEKPRHARGTVAAVGPDIKHVKVGATVLFEKLPHAEVVIDKEPFYIVNEMDVLAVITE